MKKILIGAATAVALIASSAASAQSLNTSTTATGNILSGQVPGGTPVLLGLGTVGATYTQIGLNGLWNSNTGDVEQTTTNTWAITGNVVKDCSYYGGGTTAHTLPLGQLGVFTNNSAANSNAFEMTNDVTVNVNSNNAGCNFNNTVTIAKGNALGLRNTAAGGYDSNQFQANIPYSVTSSFTGTTSQSAGVAGSAQSVNVSSSQLSNSGTFGAWRSSFDMVISAPAPTKALVAGSYSDTLTVTLAAS